MKCKQQAQVYQADLKNIGLARSARSVPLTMMPFSNMEKKIWMEEFEWNDVLDKNIILTKKNKIITFVYIISSERYSDE